jgi:ribosomal protein S18 acetylase RimI-like enzyme
MASLRPILSDPETARRLAHRAIQGRNAPAPETAWSLAAVDREIDAGNAPGVLRMEGERPVGVALWEPRSETGAALELLYLEPGRQTPEEYLRFFADVRRKAGPILFAPGLLAGLSEADESALMGSLGFARYARSEMRADLAAAPVPIEPPGRWTIRPAVPEDLPALARLHEVAYRGTFDRYLFMVYTDPRKDAELALRDIFSGRWGELLAWASMVSDEDGELRAACLVTRASDGPILVNVIVDPRYWGEGRGRAVVVASLRALRERDEPFVLLTVTEGNDRAKRLYERLGFVRSQGPSSAWYSAERIPVPPRPD